ncbi:MAG: hypothetical protein CR982_07445 [Candidatus Cloacimonadota bacterium]|nr:MAG: hypothetical protein CR982_07445 [Candidatus Cloacimonadota bacterium]PIE80166.1 MAG: hypothetical protein CSA15_02090 [Candidatus Delongbacteria bacterium]
MIKESVYEIGQAYIKLDIKANQEFKKVFEKDLLYYGKKYAKKYYNKEYLRNDLYFSVEFEDGSLKSRLKIFSNLSLIIIAGIGGYGNIRTGIDYIIKDSQSITENIVKAISRDLSLGDRIQRVERRLGVPGKIKRFFDDIEKFKQNRDVLNENEKQDLIDKIYKKFKELIVELDKSGIETIEKELIKNNLPIPSKNEKENIYLPEQFAIRENRKELISENEIDDQSKRS